MSKGCQAIIGQQCYNVHIMLDKILAKQYPIPFLQSKQTSRRWLSFTCWTIGILFLGPILLGLYLSRLTREYVNNKTTALTLVVIIWFFAVFINSATTVAWADTFTTNASYSATAGPNSKATPLPVAKNTSTSAPNNVTVAQNTTPTPAPAGTSAPATLKTPAPTAKITAAPTPAPTATPRPTAAPTPTPTPVRTPTPTPTPSLSVTFISGPGSVARSSTATVVIATAANAYCSIVTSSKSSGNGNALASGNANASGHKSWTWKVGSAVGSWPVTVTCSASRQTAGKTAYLAVTN